MTGTVEDALKRIEPGGIVAFESSECDECSEASVVGVVTKVRDGVVTLGPVPGQPAPSPTRKQTAAALMQRIAARCIDQLIKHGYVQRRDLEDLRTISREYRAAMKENA